VNGSVGLKRGTSFTQLSIYGRCGYRSSGNILYGNGANLGFRLNGVIRGGGYLSGQDSFNRCGFRIGDYRRKDGKVWLGFL